MVSRRAWLGYAGCLCIGLSQPGISRAGEPKKSRPAPKATPKTHYLISAILREGVQGFTFRLVHSVQTATSVDEATGMITRLVMEKYPGCAVAQTIATDISLPPDACSLSLQAAPRKPARTFYAVSAVLDQNKNDLDTRLVNGWLPAGSADEALGSVLRGVTAKYPGFTPASSLVTTLDPMLAGCSAPNPAFSPVRYHGQRV